MNTFTLKIIALIFMVIDHIGFYFEAAPPWFRSIGRLSYPIFLFCMIWGLTYTKNRKAYLVRLYLASICMSLFCYLISSFIPAPTGLANHNIFISMFIVGVLITTIELCKKDPRKGLLVTEIIFIVQLLYAVLPSLLPLTQNISGNILAGIIPSIIVNEYGFNFIILGVLMYFLKEDKTIFSIMYILFCACQFILEKFGLAGTGQYLMIFALPFILIYNNEKGPSLKYFFYIFYPAHIFILFYISNFVLT